VDSRRRSRAPTRASLSTPEALASATCEAALALGFDLAGVAPAAPTEHSERLREWIDRGYAGAMAYLGERLEERIDPRRVLEGARSVVVVGLVYAPDAAAPAAAEVQLARYAVGDDYHEVLIDRLRALAAAVEVLAGCEVAARAYVDTGPVAERAMAARAGLGWIGKNSCLIHPEHGSYLFLGALLLDLELAPGAPEPDHCGSCRACLDACPTDAFAEPYVLDATRCIAYTTIEDPGPIPEPLREGHGSWVFGCDICQQVCPWNTRRGRPELADPLGLRERLAPRELWQGATLRWLLGLDERAWQQATRHSAIRRAKHRGLLRNALIAAGNSNDPTLAEAIRPHTTAADPLIAEHATWALAHLRGRLRGRS
jgi:epoxyqueuosine reductase